MNKYKFDCGCEVDIIDEQIKDYDGLPSLHIDYENLNINCPITWNLLSSGKTRGVFQLETNLGASWAKKLEPDSMEELAALISILRPGTLKSKLDGKSMTQHYVDRKHGIEQYTDIDHNIASIMTETHGIMVYQEQAMQIAQKLGGFDLKQADSLRKAIGKKLADLMSKVKIEFIEGCKKTGLVDDEKANEIFDIIEKSNRYSFNKSHAVCYGMIGYWTAWTKCLSPETIVETKDGLKVIDEIKIGEYILCPKTDTEDEFIRVVNKYENGIKDVYQITLESQKTIECTIDHKFLCEDGKIRPLYEIIEFKHRIMCQDD